MRLPSLSPSPVTNPEFSLYRQSFLLGWLGWEQGQRQGAERREQVSRGGRAGQHRARDGQHAREAAGGHDGGNIEGESIVSFSRVFFFCVVCVCLCVCVFFFVVSVLSRERDSVSCCNIMWNVVCVPSTPFVRLCLSRVGAYSRS